MAFVFLLCGGGVKWWWPQLELEEEEMVLMDSLEGRGKRIDEEYGIKGCGVG